MKNIFYFLLCTGFFLSACNNSATIQPDTQNADIIMNKEKNEIILLKGKEFTKEQLDYLIAVHAPFPEWLDAGDTLELTDSITQKPFTLIIKARFGTY